MAYATGPNPDSLAGQIARDNAAMAERAGTPSGSSGGTSGGEYDAAAAAEAARQARIKEQQAIIAEVENLKSEVSEAYNDLLNAQTIIGNNITGEYAKSINDGINTALNDLEETVDNLNAIGAKAAENIRNDGEACTYDALKLNSNAVSNSGTNVIFSCDTDALREQVLPYLKNAESILTDTASSSSKLLKLVENGSASNVSPGIDNGKTVIKDVYTQVEEFINNIEKIEKENKGLIDIIGEGFSTIGSWISGLFGKDEEVKEETTKPSVMEMMAPLQTNNTLLDKVQNEHNIETFAKIYDVDTGGKTTQQVADEVNIEILADLIGVDTTGKVQEEIIEEMANKIGVKTTTTTTITTTTSLADEFMKLVKDIDKKTADERWTYGETPEHIGVEETLNINRKQMQCGTLVSVALILMGFLTEDDIRADYGSYEGVQYNSPDAIRDALIQKDCEKIVDPNELQPGDILCFCGEDQGWGQHIEVFAGYDDNGKPLVYSSGGTGLIQIEGPTEQSLINKTWEAYRLPDEKVEEAITTKKTEDAILNDVKGAISGTTVGGLIEKIDEIAGNDKVNYETTNIKVNNNSTIIEKDNANSGTNNSNNSNANSKEEVIKPTTSDKVEVGNHLNNSFVNDSIFVNTELNEMIMDKHVVELLANKYGVDVEGKTAITVLNEIATKYPDMKQDLDGIQKLINSTIKFEEETKSSESTQVEINNDSAIIEGLGTDALRNELTNIKNDNANSKEEVIKPTTSDKVEVGNNLNNSFVNDSIFVNTALNDMIMDKHVVELLANKYGVDLGEKTAITVLNEIATKYPDMKQDLDGIQKLINSTIKFEEETKSSEPTKVEINKDSIIIEGLGTDAARDELVDIKKDNANLNKDTGNTTKVPSETIENKNTEENKQTPDKNTNKPSNAKPNKENNSSNTGTKPTPIVPENTGNSIVEGIPHAIIEAAKNADANSHGEYISEILHEAGYLTEKEMNAYREYSVKELCKKFESFGWKKIVETEKLQVGDIIIINNGKEETAQIYAGNNKWYIMGEKEAKQMTENWTENIEWYAYRAIKR